MFRAVVVRANLPTEEMTLEHIYSAIDLPGTGGIWGIEMPDGSGAVFLQYGTQNEDAANYLHKFNSLEANEGNFDTVTSLLVPGIIDYFCFVSKIDTRYFSIKSNPIFVNIS